MLAIDIRAGRGARYMPFALALVFGVSACGTGGTDAAADGPVIDNCGIGVPADDPPERVFAAYQPAIEMAHALGISDRLVGTGLLDAQVLPEYANAQAEQNYYESNPSKEELLRLKPDFVLSGFNGVFAENAADASFGTRAELRELGVDSWIFSPLCPSEDGLSDEAIDPATVTMNHVYADVRDLGTIFGVPDRAEEVVADMEATLDDVRTETDDIDGSPTVMVGKPGEGGFRVSGGPDFATEIIDLAGGQNIFADLDSARNHQVSAEEVIERDPDYILVNECCDAELTAADSADTVEEIMNDPALANLTAVREGQVEEFTFADHAAGVRSARSVELVASLIHDDVTR